MYVLSSHYRIIRKFLWFWQLKPLLIKCNNIQQNKKARKNEWKRSHLFHSCSRNDWKEVASLHKQTSSVWTNITMCSSRPSMTIYFPGLDLTSHLDLTWQSPEWFSLYHAIVFGCKDWEIILQLFFRLITKTAIYLNWNHSYFT